MQLKKLDGLIAATYSPLDDMGAVNTALVVPKIQHLLAGGVNGLYVCGSTGEGMPLISGMTEEEWKQRFHDDGFVDLPQFVHGRELV